MSIFTLPPELKLDIADLLDPFSSFNFALTCKDHLNLLQPIIQKHGRLFDKYRIINTSGKGSRVIWDLTKEILRDQSLAVYVRELSLGSGMVEPYAKPAYSPNDPNNRPPQEEVDLLTDAAFDIGSKYECPTLKKYFLDTYYPVFLQELSVGKDEPVVTTLIHHLPHLETFRVTDENFEFVEFGHCLRFVEMLRKMIHASPISSSLPFQNLTTAMVAHWDTELGASPDWCLFFICLPSLRNLIGLQMRGDLEVDYDEDVEGNEYRKPLSAVYPRSNVKELCFYNSQIKYEAVEDMLKCIFNLERFSYECGGALIGYDSMEPKRIIKALTKSAAHSLEHLVLEWGHDQWEEVGDNDFYLVSLRGFQKLRTLRCPYEILFPNPYPMSRKSQPEDFYDNLLDVPPPKDDSVSDHEHYKQIIKDFDLRPILPTSLRALHLQCEPYESCYPADDPFERLLQPSPLVPGLKQIYIEWWTDEKRKEWKTEELDTMTPLPDMKSNPLFAHCEGHGCGY